MSRKPLIPMRDDDPRRLELLREKGLDADMNPIDASPLEREANQRIKEPPMEKLFSPKLKKAAGIIAGIGGVALMAIPLLAAVFTVPGWVGFAAFSLTSIAAFIAGAASPSPFAGKPILSGTAAATAATIAGLLFELGSSLQPETFLQSAVLLVAGLLFAAVGKSLPTATPKVPPTLMLAALLFGLTVPLPAFADHLHVGNIVSTGGNSANNFTTTTPFTLYGTGAFKYDVQCDAPARIQAGTGSATAATASSIKGVKDADGIFPCDLRRGHDAIAVRPASGTATLTCAVYQVAP